MCGCFMFFCGGFYGFEVGGKVVGIVVYDDVVFLVFDIFWM